MPEVRRQPSGPFEERIDFGQIELAQDRRHADTLQELRGLLFRIQHLTTLWVRKELVQKKRRAAVAKYSMPLAAKYKEILRRRMLAAHRRGRYNVAREVGAKGTPKMKTGEINRVRAEADVLYEDHRSRLETDLKRELTKAIGTTWDRAQLEYTTKLVFSNFTGWEEPPPP